MLDLRFVEVTEVVHAVATSLAKVARERQPRPSARRCLTRREAADEVSVEGGMSESALSAVPVVLLDGWRVGWWRMGVLAVPEYLRVHAVFVCVHGFSICLYLVPDPRNVAVVAVGGRMDAELTTSANVRRHPAHDVRDALVNVARRQVTAASFPRHAVAGWSSRGGHSRGVS